MGKGSIAVLRVLSVLLLGGSLYLQGVLAPLLGVDMAEAGAPGWLRTAVVTILVLGVLCGQVVVVCVWQLLTLVRRGTVFTSAAFRYVHVIIVALAVAAGLLLALGAVLAPTEVAPGIVLVIGGLAASVAAVAMLVWVMRALLAQAVSTRTEAEHLRSELDEVI
ncbi:DUF2975 domain-containing protein [Desertihabitans aurantiacus]|uniref:DUF2975 domain-containing protein n=1 Tax=Desertihabitans aurantiacus TaxID=2282477 RepID=UPI000DF7BA94|nr:DUF2975 domain-containing protein [Desertihabitans aurantiacus]